MRLLRTFLTYLLCLDRPFSIYGRICSLALNLLKLVWEEVVKWSRLIIGTRMESRRPPHSEVDSPALKFVSDDLDNA
jgi:hypothetical protein